MLRTRDGMQEGQMEGERGREGGIKGQMDGEKGKERENKKDQ